MQSGEQRIAYELAKKEGACYNTQQGEDRARVGGDETSVAARAIDKIDGEHADADQRAQRQRVEQSASLIGPSFIVVELWSVNCKRDIHQGPMATLKQEN